MKTRFLALALLLCVLIGCFASCGEVEKDPWEDAIYTEDTTLGAGDTELCVEVAVLENKVTFTVLTNEETVGGALLAVGLISGDAGAYGLYVKTVNGILADYDIDKSYWGFYIDGEYAMTGVDMTPAEEGKIYKLEYVKE